MTTDHGSFKKLRDAIENCPYIPRKGEMAGHAVIVRFDYGRTDLSALFELEDQLTQVIVAAGVGVFDGNEIAGDGSEGLLYMYGPDADALFSAVRTTLAESTAIRNAVANLRYGPAGCDTRRLKVAIER